MSKDIKKYIREKYKNKTLHFDEYMDESLYSEFGFFNTEIVRSSKEGDFLTSPEVSKYFGTFIANFINKTNPQGDVLEIGAGTGSLAKQIDELISQKLYLLETSLMALNKLKEENFEVEKNPEKLSNKNIDLIYMNELLDNIPCSIAINEDEKWYEKTINTEEFKYELTDIREENLEWIKKYNFHPIDNVELEIQYNSEKFLDRVINIFEPNYILIFDYGYEYKDRHKKPYASLLRTYKAHHLSTDPLMEPGATDITYDVNFSFLKSYFENKNFEVELTYQYKFLDNYGYDEIYKKLKNNFQKTSGVDQLKIKSDLVGLEAIHNERGLGGFYTLIAKKI